MLVGDSHGDAQNIDVELLDKRVRLIRAWPRPLGMMLLHVPNHATHHRSEIATMLTMVSGSPPDTGITSYYREKAERELLR